jgi:hypothetical protein
VHKVHPTLHTHTNPNSTSDACCAEVMQGRTRTHSHNGPITLQSYVHKAHSTLHTHTNTDSTSDACCAEMIQGRTLTHGHNGQSQSHLKLQANLQSPILGFDPKPLGTYFRSV